MNKILAAIYKNYLKKMSSLGKAQHAGQKPEEDEPYKPARRSEKTFEELDKEATLLGNAYRGIGVVIAVLGALIIFSAIAPVAFGLHGAPYWAFGITEVLSMLIVVALVIYAKKSQLHTRWREARRGAENMRYGQFSRLIEESQKSPTTENRKKLRDEALSHLSGENSQITYNVGKSGAYHKIENLSGKVGWAGFFLALVGALGHLGMHWNEFLILTVFVPALVGALHGLNSFLKLDDLAYDHRSTAEQLTMLKSKIEDSDIESKQGSQLIDIAEKIYHTLVSRDKQWADKIESQNLQAT